MKNEYIVNSGRFTCPRAKLHKSYLFCKHQIQSNFMHSVSFSVDVRLLLSACFCVLFASAMCYEDRW
jgi:hypothetical protein